LASAVIAKRVNIVNISHRFLKLTVQPYEALIEFLLLLQST